MTTAVSPASSQQAAVDAALLVLKSMGLSRPLAAGLLHLDGRAGPARRGTARREGRADAEQEEVRQDALTVVRGWAQRR
jgi:hypothetical protein